MGVNSVVGPSPPRFRDVKVLCGDAPAQVSSTCLVLVSELGDPSPVAPMLLQSIGSWLARYEFEPSTTKELPRREAIHVNLSRAQTSFSWRGVVVRRGVPAWVSSSSIDHGSKLRGPTPKVHCRMNKRAWAKSGFQKCFDDLYE
ncbi:hypothetical protein TNCV_4814351 [Trichonephila clavipes]|nr:hypothetical protein TNCV_4814351 [Trichonephila clavipes]